MDTDSTYWRRRTSRLLGASVQAAVVVQCGFDWLRPPLLELRNDIDEALLTAHVRRGGGLHITRLLLHNLPVSVSEEPDFAAVAATFAEWQFRLSAAHTLASSSVPRIHRLIIRSDGPTEPPTDRLELLVNGRWTDAARAQTVLRLIGTPGSTTPLTGYDIDLAGPFSDSDPSVHM
ncbi:hypothetical protein [Streptomyces sp. NPDC059092]|uniref:hypothetical protein n=1 Tax=Streptomyces sp. NPDC059092 TaxID=3346725 RepID=UPI0036A371AD